MGLGLMIVLHLNMSGVVTIGLSLIFVCVTTADTGKFFLA